MNAKEFVNYLKGGIELGQLTEFDQNTFEKVAEKLKTGNTNSYPQQNNNSDHKLRC